MTHIKEYQGFKIAYLQTIDKLSIDDFDTGTWTDKNGIVRKVPSRSFKRLRPSKIKTHEALRDFIFERDSYKCRWCEAEATIKKYPFCAFSKKWRRVTSLVIDHIVSIRNGSTHHPLNLQTLCDLCNSEKAGKEDAQSRF
ncbi:MAG: HNH endonuclease [Thermodesulfovibrionales bacterium]